MAIPFIDLKAQYRALSSEIDLRIAQVLEHGQYILGTFIVSWSKFRERGNCCTVAADTDYLEFALVS